MGAIVRGFESKEILANGKTTTHSAERVVVVSFQDGPVVGFKLGVTSAARPAFCSFEICALHGCLLGGGIPLVAHWSGKTWRLQAGMPPNWVDTLA